MANEEHLAVLRQGSEVWDAWRKKNPGVRPNLARPDLTGAILARAILGLRPARLRRGRATHPWRHSLGCAAHGGPREADR
jgi:hypothetical protein